MAKNTYRWAARMGFRIKGKSVRFRGRQPFRPVDEANKKDLLTLGVFEDLGDGTLRYSAPVKLRCQCPETECTWIGKDGLVEVDLDHLQPDLVKAGVAYELAAPDTEMPPPVWTEGLDSPSSKGV